MDIAKYGTKAYKVGNRYASRNRKLVLEVLGSILTVVFESAVLTLYVRTNPQTTLTLVSSDGTQDIFNTTITKYYPDATRRSVSLDTDPKSVDILNITTPGTVSLNGPVGTVDFTSFPNVVGASCVDSYCNVFKANILYDCNFSRAQCAGRVLDLSGVRCSALYATHTLCRDMAWPANAGAVIASNHALSVPQVLPHIPSLSTIYLEYNQAGSTAGMGLLDLSANPQTGSLYARQARLNHLKVAPANSLSYVDVTLCDLSREYDGQPGRPVCLAELLEKSPILNRLDAYNSGIDSDSMERLLRAVVAAGRAYVLIFSGGNANQHYLNTGGFNGRVNEALVTKEGVQVLAAARAQGCYIEFNDASFYVTILSSTTARIDYVGGTKDCTALEVGTVVICTQPFNGDLFNYGEHTVLSGSGQSFVVSNTTSIPGAAGAAGNSAIRLG
jgi:hypothetical protein